MKYCEGEYHGDVKKQIEDNEDFCTICRGRIANEREVKKEKRNNILSKVVKFLPAVVPLVPVALNEILKNGNDKS